MNSHASLPVLASLALLVGSCASTNVADVDVVTKEEQSRMTPADVLADLKAGNDRFVAGEWTAQDWLAEAEITARDGQFPKAIVLSCLDSRVPAEIVFDQGIGDLFVGRVAGNFENVDMLGSMEFGTAVAGSKLIVVLGHSSCGAVKGTLDDARLGNLTATLANIRPAVDAVTVPGQAVSSSDEVLLEKVIEANVRMTVADIVSRSPVMAERVASGELEVVGAVYDIATGRVRWLD